MPLDFHLLRPAWLWLLTPLVVLLWRLMRADGGDAWRGVVDAHLLPRLLTDDEGRVQQLPLVLLGLGWLLGVLALAGPTWERLPQPVYQAQQYRVVALDLSPGMNATDLATSRLAHARFEVLDLLREARDGQTALLAYGAEPYVVSPLTTDTQTIAAQVPSLETDLLPVQGAKRTDLALEKASELLRQAGAPDGEVILITDGLHHPAATLDAAGKLRKEGYNVSVLGIGSAKGAPVPLAGGGFMKDKSGAILLSKLDEDTLRRLASAGGGRYVTAGLDDRDVEALIPSRSIGLTKQVQKQDTRADQWREEGPLLLLVLLPLAALGFRRGWLAPLVLVVALTPVPDAHAFGWDDLWLRPDQQAQRLMKAGELKEAAAIFQRPDWRAAAQYEAGDYQQALQTLEGVQGAAADYNKGNALARSRKLEQAVAAYDRALEQNPQDEDARHNRELVKKLLKQQEQKQQSKQGQEGQKDQQVQQAQQARGERSRQEQQGQKSQQENQEQRDNKAQAEGQAEQQTGKDEEQPEAAQAQKTERASLSDSKIPNAEFRTPNSREPGLQDLLNTSQTGASVAESSENPEDRQAMEQMLRRVEDDPAGLLRQRFLLQHLRRSGQLP